VVTVLNKKTPSLAAPANITQWTERLYSVDLDLPLTGFRRFISAWIYMKEGYTLVVDPGPSASIPVLITALEALGVQRIDYLLLTHIHLDHGGGAGALLKRFPETPVNCHPKGIPHLIEPDKLWQGSLKVLGKIARAYGAVTPVNKNNISYRAHLSVGPFEIEVLETPGHASHHVCYLVDGILFAAEAGGVSLPVNGGFYQRIATPPRFIYNVYKSSLKKAAEAHADHLCLGHYGMRNDVKTFFQTADEQLERWMEIIEDHLATEEVYDEQAVLRRLLSRDPALRLFKKLERDIQKRELYFCRNSLQGMYEYLRGEEA